MPRSGSRANFASPEIGAGLALALNGEGAPDWVQLMPAGPNVQGRDGRAWIMPDALAVIASTELPFAIDYEHAQDLRAVNGEEAPAAGWAEELQARDGQIWARVAWTPKAATSIASREYRFLSPAIVFDGDNNVRRIVGAGLVNRPNFRMAALNHEGTLMLGAIGRALGLPENASETDAVAAITRLRESTALNAETLARYVPRADYDLALNRATTAEGALKAREDADHKARLEAAIEAAVKAGKVAPASKGFYLGICATKEGLAEFEKFVASAPSAFGAVDLGKQAEDKAELNAEALAVAKALGLNSPEQREAFAKGVKR